MPPTLREIALHTLATFPQPPARLTPILWELALGPKGERAAAQRCLENAPDKLDRLTRYLTVRDAESRQLAAEWLGRIGDARAIDPLLTELKREKSEFVKGAMMTALENLGAPVEQFLNRDGLLKEAAEALAKGGPPISNGFRGTACQPSSGRTMGRSWIRTSSGRGWCSRTG